MATGPRVGAVTGVAGNSLRMTALALVLACASSRAPAPLTMARRAAIVDSVRLMLDGWRDALGHRDVDRAATFYSSSADFRWIENGEIRYTSRAEMTAAMHGMVSAVRDFQLTLDEPSITALAPGVAVVTSEFAQKMTDTAGQVRGVAGAVSMTVVHGDSGWQFLVGQTSTLAPAGPAPTGRHS